MDTEAAYRRACFWDHPAAVSGAFRPCALEASLAGANLRPLCSLFSGVFGPSFSVLSSSVLFPCALMTVSSVTFGFLSLLCVYQPWIFGLWLL